MLPRKTPRRQSPKRAKSKAAGKAKPKPKREYIFLNGQKMASVVGDELQQSRDGSRHFLHSPSPAIAFDPELLRKAKREGAVRVRITDKETGCNYRTTIQAIEEHGFPVYRGAGPQVALPITAWTVTERKSKAGRQLTGALQAANGASGPTDGQTPENGSQRVNSGQLGLFGEVGG